MITKYLKGGNIAKGISIGMNNLVRVTSLAKRNALNLNKITTTLPSKSNVIRRPIYEINAIPKINPIHATLLLGGAGSMSIKHMNSNVDLNASLQKPVKPKLDSNSLLNKPFKDKDYDLSRVFLTRDGIYKDANGRFLARKGLPLIGAVWKKLAAAYGKDYANTFSMNTRNGNIFLDNKWRFNDIKSDKEGRTASFDEAMSRNKENSKNANAKKDLYGYYQLNPFNNRVVYLNESLSNSKKLLDYAKLLEDYKSLFNNYIYKKLNLKNAQQKVNTLKNTSPNTLGGYLVKGFGDATGLYKLSNDQADLALMFIYGVPYLGSIASLGDAGINFYKGDYASGVTSLIGAIPVIGNVGKMAGQGLKAMGSINKADKVLRSSDILVNASTPLTKIYGAVLLGSAIDDTIKLYPLIKEANTNIKDAVAEFDKLKAKGYTDEDLRKMYPGYDLIITMNNQNFVENIWNALGEDLNT